ncbi:hypothetical protein [Leptothrix discophora]|uniref:Type I phosphodiesterase/nucleotide pyrophosphatase n=1 Tax=Leptothrix discophora TaxID=89 RepID=A0ABT9G048_LEPDI|nr:hypothetical protein [Leptothrix discophora]MDP4299847.1 hypothetical protein [Leptothrix discophora]
MNPQTHGRRDQRLILIALNEVNFEVVRRYLASHDLPAFRRMLEGKLIRTTAETRYEDLEPWIQWPSLHNGLSAAEHGIFRLGDVVGSKPRQIFEEAEDAGIAVGCISAMNAENRLKHPAYFIPDPWTKTPTDGSWWSERLSSAVSQVVNDNASGKVTTASKLYLLAGLLTFSRARNLPLYADLIKGIRRRSWNKALLLDVFLHDLHMKLLASTPVKFSTVFLNSGAHIQHHYFLNAGPIRQDSSLRNPDWYVDPAADPVLDMLKVYDRILGEYLALQDTQVIVATGLSQRPYDRVKFYYRLRDHASFLNLIGLRHARVMPRMTRDFLIEFDSVDDAQRGQDHLSAIRVAGGDQPLFGEIDNRGSSLFVTLSYPLEITAETAISVAGRTVPLLPHVAFVAVKNGMHQSEGYAYFSPGIAAHAPEDRGHVKGMHAALRRILNLPQLT